MTQTVAAESHGDRHPIGLIVDDDLRRNRLTVFFRIILAIPQLFVISLWAYLVAVAVVIAWLAALVLGRVPDGLHAFLERFSRASTHTYAYVLLLADPWPPFLGEEGTYPVDLRVDPPAHQNRLTVLFRLILAIPPIVISYVFRIVNQVVAILGWFYCLFMGRMSEGMRDVSAWMLKYELQTYAYVLLLTGAYPSFSGGPRA